MVDLAQGAEGLEYPALEKAMNDNEVSEETRRKVASMMKDPWVIALHSEIKKCLGASRNWSALEFKFFETLSDVAGDSPEMVKSRMLKTSQFLTSEADPAGLAEVCAAVGISQSPAGVDPRLGEGRIWENPACGQWS